MSLNFQASSYALADEMDEAFVSEEALQRHRNTPRANVRAFCEFEQEEVGYRLTLPSVKWK